MQKTDIIMTDRAVEHTQDLSYIDKRIRVQSAMPCAICASRYKNKKIAYNTACHMIDEFN